jgi:drug/metabolite transporter (DMT)-like permease
MKATLAEAAVSGSRVERPIGSGDLTGILLVLGGVTCWSLGGMLVRLTDGIDAWQIILYRSLVLLIVMGLWIVRVYGPRSFAAVREAGWVAVAAGIAVGLASLCFVTALFYTTVAQTLFMAGIAPFSAALLGWWLLGERVHAATWTAMAVALVGLAIMLGGGPGGGHMFGSALALVSAFCFSCYSVLLRWGQNCDMTVAQIWNASFLIVFSLAVIFLPIPLRDGDGAEALLIGWYNVPLVFLMGTLQLSLGMILFTRGSRTVPAVQLSLLALVEPALAPTWAWLAVGEVPALSTVIGGMVLISAVAIQVLLTARR